LENLWEYCEEAEFNPYAAIDAIEDQSLSSHGNIFVKRVALLLHLPR
jgi:hypothetical protein